MTFKTEEERETKRKYWREYQRAWHIKHPTAAKDWRKVPANRLKQLLKAKSTRVNRSALNYEECLAKLETLNWRCEITGVPFVFDPPRHPNSLSIDRINAGQPYTKDNIRFVCWWINCAMGTWGLGAVKENIKMWENNYSTSKI